MSGSQLRNVDITTYADGDPSTNEYVTGRAKYNSVSSGYFTGSNDYMYFRGVRNSDYVPIHRLVAVAEYGFDAVVDKEIHHKNGMPWDNRPENLEPLSKEEHRRKESRREPLHKRIEEHGPHYVKEALRRAGYPLAAEVVDQ